MSCLRNRPSLPSEMKHKATQEVTRTKALPVQLTGRPQVFSERELDKVALDLLSTFEPLGGLC